MIQDPAFRRFTLRPSLDQTYGLSTRCYTSAMHRISSASMSGAREREDTRSASVVSREQDTSPSTQVNQWAETATPADTSASDEDRVLYTLADLDTEARRQLTNGSAATASHLAIQGYLTGIIQGINLLSNQRARCLYTGSCSVCKTANTSNYARTACLSCHRVVILSLNTAIIGQFYDETASIGEGQLLLSDNAWTDLLGRSPETVGNMTPEGMMHVEDLVRWQRLTIAFAWRPALGKIAVRQISS